MRTALNALRELETILDRFGRGMGKKKLALFVTLENVELPSAKAVLRLHEALCLIRAHPDDAGVLAAVERMLGAFAARRDLRRHRGELINQGVAGTDIAHAFYAPFARWVDAHYGEHLGIDWPELKNRARIVDWLEAVLLRAEIPGLYDAGLKPRAWVERLKSPDETDARFLIRSIAALPGTRESRDASLQSLGLSFVLKPSERGPSRSTARYAPSPVVFRTRAFRRDRPSLARIVKQPPRSVRDVSPREGRRLIDLACDAMVTRSRELDSFTFGDPRDVRVAGFDGVLQIACIGLEPAERLTLEALYGFLLLQNGVPIGYVLASALLHSSEIAFNVFETFRGTLEAAWVYGRALATVRHLLGAETFTIYPYQLGHRNDEALASGAWWFYQKLGFRPRDAETSKLMQAELAAMRRNPAHRSSRATLKKLARRNLFWSLGPERDDVIGRLPLPAISLAVTDLARARESNRPSLLRGLRRDARTRIGLADLSGWTRKERQAFDSWSPLLLLLPDLESWSRRELRALVRVVRAKGGRRETQYIDLFDGHRRLGDSLRTLARRLQNPNAGG